MTGRDSTKRAINLTGTLQKACEQGHFETAVLVGDEGLPLAIGPSTYDTEAVAAMVTLVRSFVERTRAQLGLEAVDEVSILSEDRLRLVCRYFSARDQALILAVVVPPNQSYRRLTNQAIKEIEQAL